MPYTKEQITYELFGINPTEFYKSKFALGKGHPNALAHPVYQYEIGYEGIRRLIKDLQRYLPNGGRVLDIGCGAGPYGPTLLVNAPGVSLCGMDFSSECLEQAKENGYSHVELFDVTEPLPFAGETFDFVFTMDFMGHVEFKHKDKLISEMARVTKPGRYGHHGVETSQVDYYKCNPSDPDDRVRKYVYVDGHIGVESGPETARRFRQSFTEVELGITRLWPFKPPAALAECFERDFQELVATHQSSEALQLANVSIGRLNTYFLELYEKLFGRAFASNEEPFTFSSNEHRQTHREMLRLLATYNEKWGTDFVPTPRKLFRPTAFSSITVRA